MDMWVGWRTQELSTEFWLGCHFGRLRKRVTVRWIWETWVNYHSVCDICRASSGCRVFYRQLIRSIKWEYTAWLWSRQTISPRHHLEASISQRQNTGFLKERYIQLMCCCVLTLVLRICQNLARSTQVCCLFSQYHSVLLLLILFSMVIELKQEIQNSMKNMSEKW
jgi:hypothetical protein